MPFVNAADYRPDISDINSLYTSEMLNVLPALDSYMPIQEFKALTEALPAAPLGAISVRNVLGESVVIVGTEKDIYILDNTTLTWGKVSRDGKEYSATPDSRWSFAVFGDLIIGVNQNDSPQVFDTNVRGAFRDLGGNPPRAGVVKVWGDFVALMKLTDHPNRVHWSGLNDAEWWTVGEKNCDYQDFPDGGIVQGSNEATNPLIFLQSAIYLGTFIAGSDIIFSFKKVQDKRGAKSSNAIASRGSYTFYIDEGGFFQIGADGELKPIGFEKVDRTFFQRINSSNLSDMFGVIDPFYNRVYWSFDFNGSGILTDMLIFDWVLEKWTLCRINASLVMQVYSAGYTLEGLDNVSPHIESLPYSLDSKAWQSQSPILGAFDTNYQLGSFNGDNAEAVLTSPEIMETDGTVQRLEQLGIIVDTDRVYVSVGGRFRRNSHESIVWGDEKTPSYNTGRVHTRARFRYLTFRVRIPKGEPWTHFKGFDAATVGAGVR